MFENLDQEQFEHIIDILILYKQTNPKKTVSLSEKSVKEAFAKSIGTGFRDKLNFKDISITKNKLGKPSFIINGKIKKLIKKHFKTTSFNFFLSIADEKKYSIAYVILQKK